MDIADQVGEEAFLLGAGVETTPLACYSPMHAVAGWLAFPTADCLRPETVLRRHATPARTQSFRKEGHGATLNAVPPEAHQPAWGDFPRGGVSFVSPCLIHFRHGGNNHERNDQNQEQEQEQQVPETRRFSRSHRSHHAVP